MRNESSEIFFIAFGPFLSSKLEETEKSAKGKKKKKRLKNRIEEIVTAKFLLSGFVRVPDKTKEGFCCFLTKYFYFSDPIFAQFFIL